jgi:hypothetical protein
MQLHTLIADDTKIEVSATLEGKRIAMRRDARDEELTEALQRLKPLLLDKCELDDQGANPVQVTQLHIGENKKGLFCRLVGVRQLKRGALKLKTPRLSFKKSLSPLQCEAVNRTIKAVQRWVEEEKMAELQVKNVTPTILREEELALLDNI